MLKQSVAFREVQLILLANKMQCKIADLIAIIPAVGDLVPRCRDYICEGNVGADIILRTENFRKNTYNGASEDHYWYMESGDNFYFQLLMYDGLVLHSSAVELDGRAYLFSGDSGAGKSTHTRLWQSVFGEKAKVFNDDKPALRFVGGKWFAYGTPWCGKDGININMKVPLAGICFMKQAPENKIRRLDNKEAIQKIFQQTIWRFYRAEKLDLMLGNVDKLVRQIPVFELENRPEPEAAMLSYETMRRSAEELGL